MDNASYRPFSICRFESCNRLTKDVYCNDHREIVNKRKRKRDLERYKDYNENRRNMEHHAFYVSKEWKQVRKYVMARDKGLCQQCLEDKKITKADVVHHVKYLETHPELALSPSNLICLCHSCHNYEHKDD